MRSGRGGRRGRRAFSTAADCARISPPGELTFGAIYEVIPFDNTLATVKVTTPQLRKLLEAAYGGHKGVFQVSGLMVRLAPCPGTGTAAGGHPAQRQAAACAERTWKVAMPDFLARGGDGLGAVLKTLPEGSIDLGDRTGVGLREALIAHWKQERAPAGGARGRADPLRAR